MKKLYGIGKPNQGVIRFYWAEWSLGVFRTRVFSLMTMPYFNKHKNGFVIIAFGLKMVLEKNIYCQNNWFFGLSLERR